MYELPEKVWTTLSKFCAISYSEGNSPGFFCGLPKQRKYVKSRNNAILYTDVFLIDLTVEIYIWSPLSSPVPSIPYCPARPRVCFNLRPYWNAQIACVYVQRLTVQYVTRFHKISFFGKPQNCMSKCVSGSSDTIHISMFWNSTNSLCAIPPSWSWLKLYNFLLWLTMSEYIAQFDIDGHTWF
jgi:hypothetical protein